jgi:hypothetical protein
VYRVSPDSSARMQASTAAGGGAKSGSPTSRWITRAPSRSMAKARSITSMARKGRIPSTRGAKRGAMRSG